MISKDIRLRHIASKLDYHNFPFFHKSLNDAYFSDHRVAAWFAKNKNRIMQFHKYNKLSLVESEMFSADRYNIDNYTKKKIHIQMVVYLDI